MELNDDILQRLEQIKTDALAAVAGLKTEWKGHYEELKAQGAPAQEVLAKVERALTRLDNLEQEMTRPGPSSQFKMAKSVADQLCESNAYTDWVKRVGKSQKSSYSHETDSLWGVAAYGNFDTKMETKTVIDSAAVGSSTPGILIPQRVSGIIKPGVRRLRVRDLIPRFPTTNNAVDWVKENVFTNAASPQTETVSKPESALTFVIDSSTVKTLAHWIPAAKQVLDDLAQLQMYVETRLLEGLADIEDNEILFGSGSGQHLSGLAQEATAFDTTRSIAGDTYIDTISHAISQVEDALQSADSIVVHPRDWRKIQRIKEDTGGANTGAYLLGGPQGLAQPTLWGLPVATTTAVSVGKFFVGNFGQYVALWDRMTARIDVSTEHSDYFIRNMVAIRCEERVALAVYRSDAVIYGSF